MSPEQAKGRPVDKRTDVWAFGCVLYEMLTARRAFHGEDVTDTIAAIVRGEPDWNALPGDTPRQIRLLLKRCLERSPPAHLGHRRRAVLDERDDRGVAVRRGANAGGPGPPADRPDCRWSCRGSRARCRRVDLVGADAAAGAADRAIHDHPVGRAAGSASDERSRCDHRA